MAIWPTNNALPSRVGAAAFGTSIFSLDWSYALPNTPAVPPGTVVKTYTFDTTMESWTTDSGAFTFDGTDGSDFAGASAPGCVKLDATLLGGSQVGSAILTTWEGLGVPAGATVTDAKLRCRAKYVSDASGFGPVFRLYITPQAFFDPFNETIVPDLSASGTDVWATQGETSTSPVSGPHGVSSLPIEITANFDSNNPGPPTELICKFDTVEVTAVHSGVAAVNEHFTSPPVVSDGGFVWALSRDTNNVSYLNCVNSAGTVQCHTQVLNLDSSDPGTILYLATDSNDQCYLVLADSVQAFAIDGTRLWTYDHSGGGFSQGFKIACVGGDGLVYVGNFNYANVHIEALDAATGALDHDFDTGCQNGTLFALSGTSIYLPVLASGNPGVTKFSTTGVFAWGTDFSGIGGGFSSIDIVPVIFGSHVYVVAKNDGVTGFNAVVRLADSDGSLEWLYSNADVADYDSVSVGADGTVYVLLGWNGPTPALAALDGSGAEVWRYSNADGIYGWSASVGNDGTLLLSLNTKMVRVNTSDGSEDSNLVVSGPFMAALSDTHTYIADSAVAGTLFAYTSSTPPPTTVDIIGGDGRVGLMPIEFDFTGPLVVGSDVAFELYFCGLANASAVATAAYGTPTYFVFDNPVANTDYHQTQTPVDLNGAAPGTQLFLRLRRIGNDPLDTSDANCLWTALVLEYDGSETTT